MRARFSTPASDARQYRADSSQTSQAGGFNLDEVVKFAGTSAESELAAL